MSFRAVGGCTLNAETRKWPQLSVHQESTIPAETKSGLESTDVTVSVCRWDVFFTVGEVCVCVWIGEGGEGKRGRERERERERERDILYQI